MTKQTRPSRKGLEITPHKGGRVVRKSVRVTPDIADMLAELWTKYQISLGDIVAEAVPRKYKEVAE